MELGYEDSPPATKSGSRRVYHVKKVDAQHLRKTARVCHASRPKETRSVQFLLLLVGVVVVLLLLLFSSC